mmetsp:Transcript_38652/g.56908  ORF Transcript_38652/g.56908 Transcript_38652/m.56908 type:complete len:127 (-) Transcript_38652:242-622(-)|eukprot:CAMPEP_0195510258 /NCGR_PEP_ID=MMETSP0794_2-20130614/2949_1 /TAXON_ID=515487 /ORGANISM="Stephanopyxis turris, Strain CCMP 815" /LENGTH=126 /DNA_ID=CAMNT_0040637637 /DNA_START=159 /DNA_END=539 /DNA_ORIENTATION=+
MADLCSIICPCYPRKKDPQSEPTEEKHLEPMISHPDLLEEPGVQELEKNKSERTADTNGTGDAISENSDAISDVSDDISEVKESWHLDREAQSELLAFSNRLQDSFTKGELNEQNDFTRLAEALIE